MPDLAPIRDAFRALTAQGFDVAGIHRFAARAHLHVSRRHHSLDRVS